MATNTIGQFEFLRIDGQIQIPRDRHVLVTRAGVDGTSVWSTGFRAEPARLLTVIDLPNEQTANNIYQDYTRSIRDLVQIIRNGTSWTSIDYVVLDVRKVFIQNNLAAVGGLNGGFTLLRCTWDVLPILRS